MTTGTMAARSGTVVAAPAVAVGLAVLVALTSLAGVVQPGRWIAVSALAVSAVLVASTLRRRRARRPAAIAAGALAGALAGLLVVAADALGPFLAAEGSWGSRLVGFGHDVVTTVSDGRVPIAASAGLEVGLVLGAVVLTVLVDSIAVGLRRPGIGALPLAGLWSVTLVFERPPTTPMVLAGATTLVLLLWAARPTDQPAPSARETVSAVVVACTVATLAVLMTPLATSAPGWATVRLPARWGAESSGGLLSLSSDLDLRADLGNRPDRIVLTYRTAIAELGPLRTATLVQFDGRRWAPSASSALRQATSVLWPEGTTAQPSEEVDVQVTDLDQDSLPIPLDPRTLSAGPTWMYDQVSDTVRSLSTKSASIAYTLMVAQRDLSPDTLRADRPHAIGPDASETQVVSSHAEDIRALAGSVVGDAATAYDKAVALQSWFRDSSRFTYSVDVAPPQTDDAVWDFLEDRRGYCVQFATAMTVMARSLGIPARVGVGFLPGERGTDGVWRVSATRAHAWPELWFAEAGWVRFEPTPAVQTGPPPVYADPNAGGTAEPESDVPTGAATSRPSVSPLPPSADPPSTSPDSGSFAPLAAAAVALAAVGIAAIAARRRRPPMSPERAWAQVRAEVAGRVEWSDATTPRQAADLLREHLRRDGRGSPESAAACDAVSRLVAVVETGRYAPRPLPWTAAELELWVERIVAELSRADRAASPSAPRGE